VADGKKLAGVTGFLQIGTGGMDITNSIITRCDVGVNDPSDNGLRNLRANNLLWDNTTNYVGYATDEGEILADPMFVDADGDPPDYSLRAGSPAIGAGFGGADIGAIPGPVGGATGTEGQYGYHGLRRR